MTCFQEESYYVNTKVECRKSNRNAILISVAILLSSDSMMWIVVRMVKEIKSYQNRMESQTFWILSYSTCLCCSCRIIWKSWWKVIYVNSLLEAIYLRRKRVPSRQLSVLKWYTCICCFIFISLLPFLIYCLLYSYFYIFIILVVDIIF